MIFNFGSINIDHVYRVKTLPKPGETLSAISHEKFLGGKGINQSIAIAKAGSKVCHIGTVGDDGNWATSRIEQMGVSTKDIAEVTGATGHAIIYVDDKGENVIVIAGAANQEFTTAQIDQALERANPQSDWVLLQNETNLASEIVNAAKSKNLPIAYAAAPFVADITVKLLEHINLLAVNEGEAQALADKLACKPKDIPVEKLLITKGSDGAIFLENGSLISQSAYNVTPVDTTGAGDTFLGSFLASYCKDQDAQKALNYASAASAIQVTRYGAAPAIPERAEVLTFMKEYKSQ